jgi:hypothetical protein
MRNESSLSCEELTSRAACLEIFGTKIELSSSSEDAYRRVAFRGLDRVALATDGGRNIDGSFGLGLRSRAISMYVIVLDV